MYRLDPIDPAQIFFVDDFVGAAYDNRAWAITESGGSTFAKVAGIAGQAEISITASGGTLALAQGGNCNYSIAKNIELRWRVKVSSRVALYTEIGAKVSATSWVAFIADADTSVNWYVGTRDGGAPNIYNSGVVIEPSWTELLLVGRSGSVQFLIDGVLVSTVTTVLPTGNLEPYIYGTTLGPYVRTILIDRVDVLGDRE